MAGLPVTVSSLDEHGGAVETWLELYVVVGGLVSTAALPRKEAMGRRSSWISFFLVLAIPFAGCAQTPKTNAAGSAKSTLAPAQAPAQTQTLTKIDITKWKVNLISGVHAQSVPAYFAFDDDAASSVIEIASGANKREVSYMAVVRHEQDTPIGFVGGQLGQATDGLIVINIGLSNSDDKPANFLVGDIGLVRASGQRLPVVAVSKWGSPLITKLNSKSVAASLAAPVTVNAGKGFLLNYCFAVVPNSFPLTLQFGTAKTDIVLKDFEALVPPKDDGGGFSVSMAGAIRIGADVPLEKYEASAKGQPLVRFESLVELKKGDQLAASGSRSMDTVSVNGEEIPLLAIHDGDGYFAGKFAILRPITPIKNSASVASHEVTFTSSFQAQQGDVLSATTTELGNGWRSAVSRRTAR